MEWTNESYQFGDIEDYDVYNSETGEYLGSIEMERDISVSNMPDSLEINGVEYIAKK